MNIMSRKMCISLVMTGRSRVLIGRIVGFMMAVSDYPAHNFDFKRWVTSGEPPKTEGDREYPDGYPTEADGLPETDNTDYEVEP